MGPHGGLRAGGCGGTKACTRFIFILKRGKNDQISNFTLQLFLCLSCHSLMSASIPASASNQVSVRQRRSCVRQERLLETFTVFMIIVGAIMETKW